VTQPGLSNRTAGLIYYTVERAVGIICPECRRLVVQEGHAPKEHCFGQPRTELFECFQHHRPAWRFEEAFPLANFGAGDSATRDIIHAQGGLAISQEYYPTWAVWIAEVVAVLRQAPLLSLRVRSVPRDALKDRRVARRIERDLFDRGRWDPLFRRAVDMVARMETDPQCRITTVRVCLESFLDDGEV